MIIFFNNLLLLTLVFLSGIDRANAYIPDAQSTRTKASAGAGVGAVLLNEAPLLNPATAVFYTNSSFYFQKGDQSLSIPSTSRSTPYKEGFENIVSIIDTSSTIKGGLSYQYQNTDSGKRTRYSGSLARGVGKGSSLGLTYRHTDEQSLAINDVYNQFVVGGLHVINKNIMLGFTIVDPTQTNPQFFKYTLGSQFTFNEFISLLVDAGSGDVANSSEESFFNIAFQLKSFNQFYLRYGRFHDSMQSTKGTGAGISWVGPRFSIDYALKISENIFEESDTILSGEQLTEQSFAFVILI